MSKQPSKKLFKLPAIQFPRISRFITERGIKYGKIALFSLVVMVLMSLIVIKLVELREELILVQLYESRREELVEEKSYWEDVLKRHPGYRDAAFKLAVVSLQLGLTNEAKNYIDLTLKIDPNFKEGRAFVDRLN